MYCAAQHGHLEIMKLLSQVGGARDDIRRVTKHGYSPLYIARCSGHIEVVYWLIQNGALAPLGDDVDGGGIDDMVMRRDFLQSRFWRDDKRLPILSWAQDSVARHTKVVQLLLTGTIVRSNQTSSLLGMFKGKSGILELIAHYVAGTKQQLRTLRQLTDRLPAFIADVPFVVDEDEDE